MKNKFLFNYLKTATYILLLGFFSAIYGKNTAFFNVKVTINSTSVGGFVTGGTAICKGSTSGLLTLTGETGTVIRWEYSDVSPYTSWTTIANTSTTYISGPLMQTTYFRAVVQDGSNTEETSSPAIITVTTTTTFDGGITWNNGSPSNIKAVVFDGSTGVISSDFEACSLLLKNNATVTVNSGIDVTLSLNGALSVNTGSTFTLNNTANLIQRGAENTNSGNIVVNRTSSPLKRLDYSLWSSPVSGQGLYAFSPFTFSTRFYVYKPTTNSYNNTDIGFNITGLNENGVNGTDTNNVQFANAKGYLIRLPFNHPTTATVWNGTFTGVPNNGNVSYTMTTGFNAVGNPYPSRINVHDFIDGNVNISGPLYFWRKTNDNQATTYASLTKTAYVCNGAVGGDTSSGCFSVGDEANWVINIGQGFLVYATSNTDLNFTNSMRRSSNSNQFFKASQTENTENNGLYWLNLSTSTGNYSQMAIGYSSEGTLADDRGIDGKNINQEFYLTSLIGTDEYSIQGRPDFQSDDMVLLSYKVTIAGNYTISIDHTAGLFNGGNQTIYLKDNLTNTIHDLNEGAYSFTSSAGTFTNRFEIIYTLPLGVNNSTFTTNNVIIYNQNNEFVVNSGNIIMSTIKVFDVRGRLLQERKGINASQISIGSGLANEVLLVQITSEDGILVTKKVIR